MNHRAIMIVLLFCVVGIVTVMFVHGCTRALTTPGHRNGSVGDVSPTAAERKITWQKMSKSRSVLEGSKLNVGE